MTKSRSAACSVITTMPTERTNKREFRRIGDFRKYEYEEDPIADQRTVVKFNEEQKEEEKQKVDMQKVNKIMELISTIGSSWSVNKDLFQNTVEYQYTMSYKAEIGMLIWYFRYNLAFIFIINQIDIKFKQLIIDLCNFKIYRRKLGRAKKQTIH